MQEEKDAELNKQLNTREDAADILEERITIEYLQYYLANQQFNLSPTQGKISYPLIKRYVEMLRSGNEPPPIKIDDNAIVDGHHRYISGCIHGKEPQNIPWTRSLSIPIGSWALILVVDDDYEQGYDEVG